MLFQKNIDEKEEGRLGLGCCSHPSNHFKVHFRLGFELIFNSFSMFGYQTRAFRQKSEPTHPIGAI